MLHIVILPRSLKVFSFYFEKTLVTVRFPFDNNEDGIFELFKDSLIFFLN